jgi:tripartite-type tricarboxylate transporter receptor subunit TctC
VIIGMDWFNTITQQPEVFAAFSKILRADGHTILVITAGRGDPQEYASRVERSLKEIGFEFDKIIAVPFEQASEIPELKLQDCLENKVDIYFDDRGDVIECLRAAGIKAVQVKKKRGPQF